VINVAEEDFRQIRLDIYRRVFQDDAVHSPVEGHDRNLSATATDETIRDLIAEGLSPQEAKTVVENK